MAIDGRFLAGKDLSRLEPAANHGGTSVKRAKRIVPGLAAAACLGLLALVALHRNSSIETGIWIDGSPQAVWRVLAATADYPSWNPEISRLEGPWRPGAVLELVEGTGPDAMVFHPTLLVVRPDRELRWKGYVGVPGIFDGEHRFVLEAKGNGTYLIQGEAFTGLLAGKLSREVIAETADSMRAMNRALKKRVEQHG